MTDSEIRHVSDTAYMVAYCRALESGRPDALFRDPLAERLSGARGKAILEGFPTAPMTTWMVAIRTVVIDELLREAVARGVKTIINLGAGLDTRPYRLEFPTEVKWIEVDYPDVIDFKRSALMTENPNVELEHIGLDLNDGSARSSLLGRLDRCGDRLLVLTEGVVPYLTLEQAGDLARDLRRMNHLDGWILDYVAKESHKYRQRAGVNARMKNAAFKFQPEDWFSFFGERGFSVKDLRYLPERGTKLGREAPLPRRFGLILSLLMRFSSPEKRKRFQRYAGYALLEPQATEG